VYDSLLDFDGASVVRGPAGQRLVSFAVGGMTIDVEVTSTGTGRTVMGQIVPPQRATVDIRHPRDMVTVEADDLGRFRSGPLPPGPASLRLHPPPGARRARHRDRLDRAVAGTASRHGTRRGHRCPPAPRRAAGARVGRRPAPRRPAGSGGPAEAATAGTTARRAAAAAMR